MKPLRLEKDNCDICGRKECIHERVQILNNASTIRKRVLAQSNSKIVLKDLESMVKIYETVMGRHSIKLGGIYDWCAECICHNSTSPSDFDMASRYSLKSLEITRKVFGKFGTETAHETMKLCSIIVLG